MLQATSLNKLGYILKIRFLQIFRILKSVGALLIIILPILFFFSLSLFAMLEKLSLPYILGLELIILISIHLKRKDYVFLQKIELLPVLVFWVEYVLLLLPLNLLLVFLFQKYWVLPLGIFLPLTIVFIPPISGKVDLLQQKEWLISWIPIEAFEWRAGFRKNAFTIYLFYFISAWGNQYLAFPILGFLLLTTIITSFYEEIEPKSFIEYFFPAKEKLEK